MHARDQKAIDRLMRRLPKDLGWHSVDALRGFLFVVVTDPIEVMPAEWLGFLLFGEDEAIVFDSEADAQASVGPLMELYNSVVDEADHRAGRHPDGCRLRKPAHLNALPDSPLSQWCLGAARAMEWLWEDWDSLGPSGQEARDLAGLMCVFATPKGLENLAAGSGQSLETCAEALLHGWPELREEFVLLSRAPMDPPMPAPPLRAARKVGRNDPCPCGSGKKYKKCCLGKEEDALPQPPAEGIVAELARAIEEQDFETFEQAEAFAKDHMRRFNESPAPGFEGLSPRQMGELLYSPFEASVVTFAERLDIAPDAEVAALFRLLADALGEAGLKATAAGSLPREFCREAALTYFGEAGLQERARLGGINKEADFHELHITRLIAQHAGLVRKAKGRWLLTKTARQLLADGGTAAIYPKLLRGFAVKVNWAYQDRYPDFRIIQQSFAFTLYLLSRYGDTPRPQAFYEDAFIAAYPAALDEAEPSEYQSAEDQLRRCYTLRAMERFAAPLGLVALEPVEGERPALRNYTISKRPLLDAVVRFDVGRETTH